MQDSGDLSDRSQDDPGAESPVDSIKKIAESEVKKQRTLELAIVKNIYPHSQGSDNDNYECDVELKNGGGELRKVPIMTPHIGLAWVPNVSDLVLIGYIGGNVNSPVVIGSLYNDDQRPPTSQAGELIYLSPDSKDSKLKRMYYHFPGGLSLLVKDDMVRVNAGKLISTIRSNGEYLIDYDGKTKLYIDPNSGDVSIKGMNVKIEATGSLELSAPNVKIDGKAVTEIKGGVVNIN